MINKVEIKNFKSISSLEVHLSRFNILCGNNSTGKTSFIHSLIALSQDINKTTLDGNVMKIGSFQELRNFESNEGIEISAVNNNGESTSITFKTDPERGPISEKSGSLLRYDSNIYYVPSNRVGVLDAHSKGNFKFGINGENYANFLFEHSNSYMPEEYMILFNKINPNTLIFENRNFSEHVKFWFEQITGDKLNIDEVEFSNQYIITYGNANKKRTINTGTGLSYVLPLIVITLGLILNNGEKLLIIENPEIYLHPNAQEKLTLFLSFVSNFYQLIIETHSVHVIRHSLKNTEDIQLLVYTKNNNKTVVETINSDDFLISPLSYSEVWYKAFDLNTIEYHILLFETLQTRLKSNSIIDNDSIKKMDTYLESVVGMEFKDRTHSRNNQAEIQYKTLPTYIRNCINHPGQINNETGQEYSYTEEELKKSIVILRRILRDL